MAQVKKAIWAAFPITIPVMAGYLFMGMAFGVLLQSIGYHAVWAFVMGLFVYAGSGQFLAFGILAAGFNPLLAFFMTLMVNARHFFYGISMLERFKMFGKTKLYMIASLTDETFALLSSAVPPAGVRAKPFYLAIAMLDHLYWVVGCTVGGLLGAALPMDTKGIDFVMTALFVVVLLEQWQQKNNRISTLIGVGGSLLCRVLFGPQWFILAAMMLLLVVFTVAKKPLEGRLAVDDNL